MTLSLDSPPSGSSAPSSPSASSPPTQLAIPPLPSLSVSPASPVHQSSSSPLPSPAQERSDRGERPSLREAFKSKWRTSRSSGLTDSKPRKGTGSPTAWGSSKADLGVPPLSPRSQSNADKHPKEAPQKDGLQRDTQGNVASGPVGELLAYVQHLVSGNADIDVFARTHPYFLAEERLLEILLEPLLQSEAQTANAKLRAHRVLKFLGAWLSCGDRRGRAELVAIVERYLERFSEKPDLAKETRTLRDLLVSPAGASGEPSRAEERLRCLAMLAQEGRPLETAGSNGERFLQLDLSELAMQLTGLEQACFDLVDTQELLFGRHRTADSLAPLAQMANHVERWVFSEVLRCASSQARTKTIERFVLLADTLCQMANLSTSLQIISALSSRPVARLRHAWASLDPAVHKLFHRLLAWINPDDDYQPYREHLPSLIHPRLPFFPVIIKDLDHAEALPTFLNPSSSSLSTSSSSSSLSSLSSSSSSSSLSSSSIPTSLSTGDQTNSQLVNWHKMRMLGRICASVHGCHQKPFQYPPSKLREWVLARPLLTEDEIDQLCAAASVDDAAELSDEEFPALPDPPPASKGSDIAVGDEGFRNRLRRRREKMKQADFKDALLRDERRQLKALKKQLAAVASAASVVVPFLCPSDDDSSEVADASALLSSSSLEELALASRPFCALDWALLDEELPLSTELWQASSERLAALSRANSEADHSVAQLHLRHSELQSHEHSLLTQITSFADTLEHGIAQWSFDSSQGLITDSSLDDCLQAVDALLLRLD